MRLMPIIPEIPIMPIIPEIPIIPEMPIIPPKGMDRSEFSDGSDSLKDSEGNGKERKRAERSFGEKRV